MSKWLYLFFAIGSEIAASLSLKAALDQPRYYVIVVVGYATSFVLLSRVLQAGMPLGIAYAIWGALGVAFTASLSSVIFDEPFTRPMVIGIVFVIAGVLIVELGSQAANERKTEGA